MKIHLIQTSDNKQNLIRSLNHSEEIVIERTQVKVIDRYSGETIEGFTLEGLGQLAWMPIETTGNHEVFVQIFVGSQIEVEKKHPSIKKIEN